MNREELEKKKWELVEILGVELEKDPMSPVAARIFAILILSGKQGVSFDELVSGLNASKSTVSTSLEQLQVAQKVKYFTKPGKRKRYFTIHPDLMLKAIDEMIGKWETQKQMHEQVVLYKQERNKLRNASDADQEADLDFHRDYLTFLEEATVAIRKLKHKISNRNNF